jgi:hypothetical protein
VVAGGAGGGENGLNLGGEVGGLRRAAGGQRYSYKPSRAIPREDVHVFGCGPPLTLTLGGRIVEDDGRP